MTFSEFKKLTQRHDTSAKLYEYSLEKLEIIRSIDDKRVKLLKDSRSFIDEEGIWHMYPIFVNSIHVYVVCPISGVILRHGSCGEIKYYGHRVSDCIECQRSEKCEYNHKGKGYFIEKPSDI